MKRIGRRIRARVKGRIAADVWHAMWRYRTQTFGAAALMVVAKLAGVSVPLVLREIIDDLGHRTALALFPVFLVLAYALLRFIGDALGEARDVVFSTVTQHTVAGLAERTFARLHRLGARYHSQRETGSIVRDVQKGTDGVGYLLSVGLFTILPALIEIGTVIGIIASNFNVTFSWIIAATLVAYATYTVVFTRRRMLVQREVNRLEAASDSRLVDSMLNYDTVKYFAAEEIETARYRGVLSEWIVARLANQRALTALHLGQSAIVCLGIAVMMLLAVQYVVGGRMTLGDLVLVNAYIVQVCMPLNTLGFVFRETNDALVNVERMFIVLAADGLEGGDATADEDRDEPGATPLIVTEGEIAFEQVDFGYDPGRQILHEVDFRARAGTTMAVVGGSGSGKSTLVRLLFRLYAPTRGKVTIERILGAAGGVFRPMAIDGRVAYVASLPLLPVVGADGTVAPTVRQSAARLDGIKVLAIDDDEEARDALEEALVATGARVELAASGDDALRRLREATPADWPGIVLCDISLGEEDGCEVLKRIRAMASQYDGGSLPPAIALTGHNDAAVRERTARAGFGAHFVKPVPIDALAGEIRRLAVHG